MYTTGEIATRFQIHPNTVRFYDEQNYFSPVPRDTNGYRIFSRIHINQIAIIRLLFLPYWPGRKIRTASISILERLSEWKLAELEKVTETYIKVVEDEIDRVHEALKRYIKTESFVSSFSGPILSFRQGAQHLGITRETLRNWERNGFFCSLRDSRNHKIISQELLQKLEGIYFLRLAGFSMSAVHRLLNTDRAEYSDEIYSAGDNLLEFLQETLRAGKKIPSYLN